MQQSPNTQSIVMPTVTHPQQQQQPPNIGLDPQLCGGRAPAVPPSVSAPAPGPSGTTNTVTALAVAAAAAAASQQHQTTPQLSQAVGAISKDSISSASVSATPMMPSTLSSSVGAAVAVANVSMVGPGLALGQSTPATVVGSGGSGGPPAPSTTNQDLAALFECPVCFDYVLPPILQCHAGHLVCSSCRSKLTCCPTCRGQLGGNIRNLAMEKVASTVMFPCKYQSSGCSGSLLHTDKLEHEEVCEFRPYMCPCPGTSCKWQGSLEQVMGHLRHAHQSITTLQGEDIVFLATDINLPGAVDWVMMQSCFGCNFMLVLEKQEKYDGHQQFFAVVQLIGTRKQAENFAYRLELNGHRRRLTWEATPRSIHEGVSSAIGNSDCLVFDTSMAQLFADNGNLGINVTISLC